MSLVRLEHAALIAMAAALPAFEAPKNLLWLAWLALWLFNRARARDFGGPWDRWDTLILLWIASGYAAAAFAGIQHGEWGGTNDVLRYGSVLWVMKRSALPGRVLVALLVALAAGALLTLAWGYYGLLVTEERRTLGLKSVGHVNHSAIYLAIVFGAALIALRAWWNSIGAAWRAAGLAAVVLFGISLFVMQSRGALGAAFIAALVLLGVHSVRLRHGLRRVGIGALVVVGLALALQPEVLEKSIERAEEDNVLAFRGGIWRSGLLAWREFPLFGVGIKNWEQIKLEDLQRWGAARGERFEPREVVLSSHGHSLYVNTLVERGAAGFAALVAVLAAWLLTLIRRLPEGGAPPLVWACWGGAASAWLVAVIVGTVNTTLHHEHALLSMLLLGAWLSLERPRPAAA